MKIVIIGPGAMGCLFAAFLAKSHKNEMWLLGRLPSRKKNIQSHGIKVTGVSRINIPSKKIKITTDPKQIGLAELVIVLVKSYDTKIAVKKILPCISQDTAILSLQNGLNNISTIKSILRNRTGYVFGGITSHGATQLGDGIIKHAGKGETVIGPLIHEPRKISMRSNQRGRPKSHKKLRNISQVFNDAGIKVRIVSSIENVLWSKLVLNSGINPLTAIFRKKNGDLIKIGNLKKLLTDIVKESARVAKKKGVKLLYNNPEKKVVEVCQKTKENVNSMLQDVLKNKQTEIDYINGAIIKEAKKLKVPAPLNKLMYLLVKIL